MQYVKPSDQKTNCLRWRPNESWSHVLKKLEIAYYLRRQGWSFYTEVNFTTPYSGRADLLVFQGKQRIIIEVLETEKTLTESKKRNYPPWEILVVHAKEQFTEALIQ